MYSTHKNPHLSGVVRLGIQAYAENFLARRGKPAAGLRPRLQCEERSRFRRRVGQKRLPTMVITPNGSPQQQGDINVLKSSQRIVNCEWSAKTRLTQAALAGNFESGHRHGDTGIQRTDLAQLGN